MDLSQLAGKIGLMSASPSLFSPSFEPSNHEQTSKQKNYYLSLDHSHSSRPTKMPKTEPSLYNTGLFTPLQWMELEHQALIYKYINAKAPIPSSLLVSICRSLMDPSSTARSFNYNSTGWFNFTNTNKKNSKGDAYEEEGRCRRTDGKKWRCARTAVPEHKYCERHLVRKRSNRSRKLVEPQQKQLQEQHQQQQQEQQQQEKQKYGRSELVCEPFGRTSLNKEKSTINPLNFKQQLPKYPSTLSYQQPVSSNNTVLNFSSRSSYSKNNLSFSPAISPNCGEIELESPSHLLQDFIGELTKIKPSQNKKEFDFTQIGPLGEILGNSGSKWTL